MSCIAVVLPEVLLTDTQAVVFLAVGSAWCISVLEGMQEDLFFHVRKLHF
jgi:hypothetical protein